MEILKLRFQTLKEKIDALSLRERLLVFLAVIAAILGLWETFIYQSIRQEQQQFNEELVQIEAKILSQTTLAEQLLAKTSVDPNKATRNQLARTQADIRRTKSQIDAKAAELISPQQMAKALEELLLQHREMVLIKLETLSPTKLFAGSQAELNPQAETNTDEVLPVYRHGLKLEIEGGYFETIQYLTALESLQWRFYWDRVDYQRQDYPLARIKIEIYTLSFEEGWLGV